MRRHHRDCRVIRWEGSATLHDPWMLHCLVRLHAAIRIPMQTLGDKVDKELVVASKNLLQSLRRRSPALAFGVDNGARRAA